LHLFEFSISRFYSGYIPDLPDDEGDDERCEQHLGGTITSCSQRAACVAGADVHF
jgi:hypothetical protein